MHVYALVRHIAHLPLFISLIINSCPKELQQDIWFNTIAGFSPWGALQLAGHWNIYRALYVFDHRTLQPFQDSLWGECFITPFSGSQTTGFTPTVSSFVLASTYLSHCFTLSKRTGLSGCPQIILGHLADVCGGDFFSYFYFFAPIK